MGDAFEEVYCISSASSWVDENQRHRYKDNMTAEEIEELVKKSRVQGNKQRCRLDGESAYAGRGAEMGGSFDQRDHQSSFGTLPRTYAANFNNRGVDGRLQGCTVYRDETATILLCCRDSAKAPSFANPEHIMKRRSNLRRMWYVSEQQRRNGLHSLVLARRKGSLVVRDFWGIDEGSIFCPGCESWKDYRRRWTVTDIRRYDFQFINKRGYQTTIEGLSEV